MKTRVLHFVGCLLAILVFSILSPASAGTNVVSKKDMKKEVADGVSSFIRTDHNATASETSWSRLFAVCKSDCIFSGFDGTVENLAIDGVVLAAGQVEVANSRLTIDKLGEVILYVGPDLIVLVLSAEQLASLPALLKQ